MSQYDRNGAQAGEIIAPEFSPKSLRRWLKDYEDLGITGLYDRRSSRGNRERRLCEASRAILADCARGYMTKERKTQSAIYADVRRAFGVENERRRSEGRPKLVPPSRETVRKAIHALDPYQCDVARHGPEYARRKHAPVGTGLDVDRPLQRVEMDTWKVDIISIMSDLGVLDIITEEDRISLGLTGKRRRWYLTAAICAATRCCVAMRLSRSPNSQATVQTIDMITQDKGIWSDAVGALTPWDMCGTPEAIVTDCGSEYVSYDARVVARDLGIRMEHAPGGLPEMRGRIERLFRTISIHLMPRLTGRTFGNMIERGDYDAKARAALSAEELCEVLVRWVVDIYHRMPNEGLGGETPAECWERLTETYGVAPAADLRRRRLAFGTRITRVVQKDGITVLGVRYHSDALATKILRRRDRSVELRWYGEDLGAIEVEIDGEWMEVPAVFDRYRGVRAQTWLAARRELRARFKEQAALGEQIVLKTIDDIEAINDAAMRRVGLLAEDWSEERLRSEEDRLFSGFRTEPTSYASRDESNPPGLGEELRTAVDGPAMSVDDRASIGDHPAPAAAPTTSNHNYDDLPRHEGGDDYDFDFEDKI